MSCAPLTPSDADGIYERLIGLHEGRSEAQSARLNVRLIFLLIDRIRDPAAVYEAIDRAETFKEELNR